MYKRQAQLLIAGINLYLLGKIMNWLLGWPLWVGLIVAAVVLALSFLPRAAASCR